MKQMLAWLFLIVAWASGVALADEGVPYAQDLRKDAKTAQDKNGVLLVVFSGEYCRYCDIVLKEFLIPMSRNADYQSKLVMRKVEMSGAKELLDFKGNKVAHRKFARDNGARMMPTVMIFDAKGHPLAKPVVGITTVDFYGFYLDQAINEGLEKVRKRS